MSWAREKHVAKIYRIKLRVSLIFIECHNERIHEFHTKPQCENKNVIKNHNGKTLDDHTTYSKVIIWPNKFMADRLSILRP